MSVVPSQSQLPPLSSRPILGNGVSCRVATDRAGAFAATVCALHCALLPFLLAFIPGIGIGLFGSPWFESAFTMVASLVGVVSLAWGWRNHRRLDAWQRLIPGLGLLWIGAFLPWAHDHAIIHAVSMAAGGGFIAAAHWRNLHLTRNQHIA